MHLAGTVEPVQGQRIAAGPGEQDDQGVDQAAGDQQHGDLEPAGIAGAPREPAEQPVREKPQQVKDDDRRHDDADQRERRLAQALEVPAARGQALPQARHPAADLAGDRAEQFCRLARVARDLARDRHVVARAGGLVGGRAGCRHTVACRDLQQLVDQGLARLVVLQDLGEQAGILSPRRALLRRASRFGRSRGAAGPSDAPGVPGNSSWADACALHRSAARNSARASLDLRFAMPSCSVASFGGAGAACGRVGDLTRRRQPRGVDDVRIAAAIAHEDGRGQT